MLLDIASDDHEKRICLLPTHIQIEIVSDFHIHVAERIFIRFTEICEARHIMVR